jgi:hypothetical protein
VASGWVYSSDIRTVSAALQAEKQRTLPEFLKVN